MIKAAPRLIPSSTKNVLRPIMRNNVCIGYFFAVSSSHPDVASEGTRFSAALSTVLSQDDTRLPAALNVDYSEYNVKTR